MANNNTPEYRITVDQLRPGVFIRLIKANWFDHPFLFSSFKVKDTAQIALIRKLGIKEVICIPEKCEILPLKPAEKPAATAEEAVPAPDLSQETIDHLWEIKKERVRRLKEKKERIAKCEEQFSSCIKVFNNILAGVLGGRLDSVDEAVAFVDRLSAYFLDDRESTLHLMNVVDQAESAYSHPMNVAVLSMMIGREAGLAPEAMTALGLGALFHDVGKAHLPRKLIRRREGLSKMEQELLDKHAETGAAMVTALDHFPASVARIVAQHHERMDGSGTPQGLSGDAIDPMTRIVAIADVYDNHTNHPDEQKSLTPYLALSYMFGQQKQYFDLEMLALFIRCLGVYPPGTVVELSNGSVGMVMAVNPKNQLNPSVVLYDEEVPKKEALIVDLADEEDLRVEKSIRLAHLEPKVLEYLSPRTRITYFVDPS